MTTTPSAPPDNLIEAVVAAAIEAVPLSPLEVGPVVRGGDDHPVPDDAPVFLSFTVSGGVEGTVVLAVGDEFEQRLTYATGTSEAAEALAPAVEAIVGALRTVGPLDATPLAGATAADWPGQAPVVASVGVTDRVDLVFALAFALTVAEDATAGTVAGPGTSSLSTSTAEAPLAVTPLGRAPLPSEPLSAEAARLGAVEVELAGVLGEATIELHDLLDWLPGVIIPLHRSVGEPVDLRINDVTVAHAEVVVVDEHYGLRVMDIVTAARDRAVRQPRPPRATKSDQ